MTDDASRRLTCLIPDLPAVLPGWLSRAVPAPAFADGLEARLGAAFGLETAPLPVAALSRIGDGGAADDGWWLRADPVFLEMTVDQLVLSPRSLNIDTAEAGALVEEIGRFFRSDHWQLEARDPNRWYLRLPDVARIETTPLREAAGRDVGPLLPRGPDARLWRRYFTELQMLLAASTVNAAREQRSDPVINGVWLWGEGRLPATAPARRWTRVWGGDELTRGLALFTQTPISFAADAYAWLANAEPGDHLLVLSNSEQDNSSVWTGFEHDWCAPLRKALGSGTIEFVRVYAHSGPGYHLDQNTRHIWNETRALVRKWLSR